MTSAGELTTLRGIATSWLAVDSWRCWSGRFHRRVRPSPGRRPRQGAAADQAAATACGALKSFRIHDGFQLEPVAVEPLVTDPVSVCYDADGRLYVVEMRGYPLSGEERPPATSAVSRTATATAGSRRGRSLSTACRGRPGSSPTTAACSSRLRPDILYAKDTNGDGVADVKKVMFSGFGTENVQGLLNGLLWGPDGWIYGVASSNGGTIQNRSRPEAKPVSVRGRDFRFKPDGSAFEAISGGGQFGHSFDDWGHRFTCNNSNHIRQIVLPSHYLERNPALIPPAGDPRHRRRRAGGAGVSDQPAGALAGRAHPPASGRSRDVAAAAADRAVRHRLLHLGDRHHDLSRLGLSAGISRQRVRRRRGGQPRPPQDPRDRRGDVPGHAGPISNVEFLASTDNWFRPVNFANTPDGTLLILDMYRETIEHPVLDPRADQEAPRPDQRQGPRPAL